METQEINAETIGMRVAGALGYRYAWLKSNEALRTVLPRDVSSDAAFCAKPDFLPAVKVYLSDIASATRNLSEALEDILRWPDDALSNLPAMRAGLEVLDKEAATCASWATIMEQHLAALLPEYPFSDFVVDVDKAVSQVRTTHGHIVRADLRPADERLEALLRALIEANLTLIPDAAQCDVFSRLVAAALHKCGFVSDVNGLIDGHPANLVHLTVQHLNDARSNFFDGVTSIVERDGYHIIHPFAESIEDILNQEIASFEQDLINVLSRDPVGLAGMVVEMKWEIAALRRKQSSSTCNPDPFGFGVGLDGYDPSSIGDADFSGFCEEPQAEAPPTEPEKESVLAKAGGLFRRRSRSL